MMHAELVLEASGQSVPVTEAPLHVGRGPANHLVIPHDAVSWNHAQIWLEGGRGWIRDLGSRNGTFLNGERVRGPTTVSDGDLLRFGLEMRARFRLPFGEAPSYRVLQLEEIGTGLQFMLRANRFHIGSGADAHLRVEGPDRVATLLIHDDEIWLGTDDTESPIELNEIFEVAGRRMRVVEARLEHVPTVEHGLVRYPYAIRVLANGPVGPEAWLTGPAAAAHHADGNRAILLLLLARSLARDRESGLAEEECGWCSDDDVRTGIWGRGKGTKSGLNVLIHRARKQLQSDGFDPWFIEKKRRGIRIDLSSVTIEEEVR